MKIAIIGNFSHSLEDPYDREAKRFAKSFAQRLGKHHTVSHYGQKEELENAESFEILTEDELRDHRRLLQAGNPMAALSIVNKAYIRTLKRIDEAGHDIIHNISDQLAPLAASSRLNAVLVTTLLKKPDKNRINFLNDNPEMVDSYFCAPTARLKRSWKLVVPNMDIAHIPSGSLPAMDEIVLNLGRPKEKALWIGNIESGCGLERAIKACNLAGTGLNIAGQIQDKNYYRNEVLPYLTAEDKYHGDPKNLDLRDLMEKSRVGIWTTKVEGPLPLGALKMLCHGLPIVAEEAQGISAHITSDIGSLTKKGESELAMGIAKAKDLCRVKVQQKTLNTYGANETTARYLEIFRFVKALQDESKKQQAYRHLCSSSWRGTLGES